MNEENELPSSIAGFQFFGILTAVLGLIASGFYLFELSQLSRDTSPLPLMAQSISIMLGSVTWWAFVNVITHIAKNIKSRSEKEPTTSVNHEAPLYTDSYQDECNTTPPKMFPGDNYLSSEVVTRVHHHAQGAGGQPVTYICAKNGAFLYVERLAFSNDEPDNFTY